MIVNSEKLVSCLPIFNFGKLMGRMSAISKKIILKLIFFLWFMGDRMHVIAYKKKDSDKYIFLGGY